MEAVEEILGGGVGQVRERRERAHATSVRPGVPVTEALVIARQGKGHGGPAVADGDEAGLRPGEPLLDEERAFERGDRGRRLGR